MCFVKSGMSGVFQHSRSQIRTLLPHGQTVEPHSLFQGKAEQKVVFRFTFIA